MIENIYDTTIEILESEIKSRTTLNDSGYYMMKHLVKLLGEHEWNQWVQGHLDWIVSECKKHKITDEEERFGFFFQTFHKSMRQTDVYNLGIYKTLGSRLKEDEVKYWEEYAKKHGCTLSKRKVGRNEFERIEYTLHYHHASGYLDGLFYELVCATMKVQYVMEYLWEMHNKGYKNFKDYSWSDDYFDMQKTKTKYGLTKE